MLLLLLACLLCTPVFSAIHVDQAGATDWHKGLVGTPSHVFYTRTSQRSQLFVGTERNVLALISPKTGNSVWRQVLEPSDDLLSVRLGSHGLLSISGRRLIHTRLWDAKTGFLVWDQSSDGDVSKPAADLTFTSGGDVVTLIHGETVTRLSGEEGSVLWSSKLETSAFYRCIYAHGRVLYLIGTKQSRDFPEVSIIQMDAITGRIIEEYQPPNGAVRASEDIFVAGDAEHVYLYWNGVARAYRHILGRQADVEEVEEVFGIESAEIVTVLQPETMHPDIILRAKDKYLIARNPHTVLHTFERAHLAGNIFASAHNLGKTHVLRLTRGSGEELRAELVDSTSAKAIGTYSIPFNERTSGPVQKAFLDVFPKKDGSMGFRIFIITADGSTQLLKDGAMVWTKEEALTKASAAVYVDLPEKSLLSQVHDELNEQPEETASITSIERYMRRVRSHYSKVKALPERIVAMSKYFFGGSSTHDDMDLRADMLGVRKVIVFASKTGKVVAYDTERGRTVWERYFGGVSFWQVENIRTSVVKYPPVITLVGNRDESTTLLYRLNALTGDDYPGNRSNATSEFGLIRKVMKLPLEEPEDRTHLLALVGQDSQVYLHPASPVARGAFETFIPTFHLYLTEGVGSSELGGFKVTQSPDGDYKLTSTWKVEFPDDEKIAALGEVSKHEHVASLGRVLGNRSVLYKYLNPNLLALATIATTGTGPLDAQFTSVVLLYLIDTVTGSIHYRAEFKGAGHVLPDIPSIHLVQSENWAVVSYWNHGPEAAPSQIDQTTIETEQDLKKKRKKRKPAAATSFAIPDAKGFEMAALEFYESAKPDSRLESNTFSSFQSKRPHVIAQSYAFPKRINAMALTATGAGITTKEVLLGLAEGHLYGVNKRLLDPRRPVGAPTADEKEEGVLPYRATLDFNPKEVASYHLYVPRIEHVLSSATKLESTSLTIAWGLDIFCARRSPSKSFDVLSEGFNYGALLTTIAALILGIWVAKGMAQRKKLNDLWK
ncbi:hypothetical protein SpCBS45565_g01990 [Spizellomyces sp. 'palustris']|nr:hypothetical protein SpCBS45565_g01990 [Spizellomyces sp. 'palustris']